MDFHHIHMFQPSVNNNGTTRLGDALSASFRPANDLTVARDSKVGASSFGGAMHLSPDTEQKYWSFGSGNGYRQKTNESSADNLLDPKLAWSSSQLPSNVGAHHSMSQRSNSCSINIGHGARMFGQTSASASPVVPQTKIDFLFSGDTSVPRIASESSIPRLQTELSSSTCSFDGLLNSMMKVEKDDIAFGDDLGCDFYSLGACIFFDGTSSRGRGAPALHYKKREIGPVNKENRTENHTAHG